MSCFPQACTARTAPGPRLAAALLGLLGACRCVVPLGDALDDLRAAGFRAWSTDEDVSLIAPWEGAEALEFRRLVAANLRAVERAFALRLARPLDVRVERVAARADGLRPSLHGAVGHTLPERDGLVLFAAAVPPTSFTELERTVRHELAHLATRRAGLEGPTWFEEGLAVEIESARLVGDELQPTLDGEFLGQAVRVHRLVSLAELLAWRENGPLVASGREEPFLPGRPLAWSFLRFQLEADGHGTFVERLRRIAARSRTEFLALEPAWRAWLETRD